MRALALILGLCAAAPVAAQDVAPPAIEVVLIIDRDRLYSDSARGQAIEAAIQVEAEALQAENDRIQNQLIAEERSLTERRPTMDVDAFRAEAEAFDARVQDIRRAQDRKLADLERSSQEQRDAFFIDVRDIVGQLMLARGGTVVLDRRVVYLAVGAVDITADAIAAIDGEAGAQE